jgi:hypothetical protein
MRSLRIVVMLAAATAVAGFCSTASAVSPSNPYRSFNLSGINYGSMRWEQAQQRGQRVWPYYNTPSRSYRGSGSTVGGAVIGGGGVGAITSGSRTYRPSRSRRR